MNLCSEMDTSAIFVEALAYFCVKVVLVLTWCTFRQKMFPYKFSFSAFSNRRLLTAYF
jgi:hypothetical protein